MTKEEFEQELLKAVTFSKNQLERTHKPKSIQLTKPSADKVKTRYNPFEDFDEKYFNIRLLSNLEGLYELICEYPDLSAQQINLFIMSNYKYKTLNNILNFNTNFVTELIKGISTPTDIAISYAIYCEVEDCYKKSPIR